MRHAERLSADAPATGEYFGLPQEATPDLSFHVEHIVARQHGGTDDLANLALACGQCNLHKGPNVTAIDPWGGDAPVALFNPRETRGRPISCTKVD